MDSSWVYRAEYSLSDRSSCKGCKNGIGKDVVRLCIMVQSGFHDGKDAHWHHPHCFFKKKPSVNVDEIWHFHDLRWDDQQRIRRLAAGKSAKIEEEDEDSDDEPKPIKNGEGKRGKSSAGKASAQKKRKTESSVVDADWKKQIDMIWECKDAIAKMSSKDLKALLEENDQHVPVTSKVADRVVDMLLFGATAKCQQCSSDRGHIVVSADAYYCIGQVSDWAKCDYKTQKPARNNVTIPEKLLEKYEFLSNYLPPKSRYRMFPKCFAMTIANGEGSGASASARSGSTVVDGPSTSKSPYSNGSGKKVAPAPKVKKLNVKQPLKGMKVGAVGKLSMTRAAIQKTVTDLGGTFVAKASGDTLVVISDSNAIASRPVMLEMAEVCHVHVVPVEFLDECSSERLHTEDELAALIERVKINPWKASNPLVRIHAKEAGAEPLPSGLSSTEMHRLQEEKKTAMMYALDDNKMKVIVKNGGAVDPQSGLDEDTHSVLKENGTVYACVLAKADVQMGSNSFYKMQIIQRDNKPVYHFFRSWGRIGTTIGGDIILETDKDDAVEQFEFHFKDKTGNEWADKQNFQKKPGKYFVMDLDFGEDETVEEYAVAPGSKTKLAGPIQELIKMIFDVEEMKKTMKAFEIDLKKMPLGKLSRRQITDAMKVLNDLQSLIQAGERLNSPKYIDGSNRFFTFIPHVFSAGGATVLNKTEDIKAKLDMLDNLLEIEVAFSILRSGNRGSDQDPLDQHYEKLKCDLEVVKKKSWDYEMVQRYIRNTHAATHSTYKLELLDVFKVRRSGESARFAEFQELNNHKLLWHGSRTTNFAGILSQGLRIAPPEAPVTGYMFGKGVYFADMVSKSANYCFTSQENNVGLLLLSDVALGKMKPLNDAECITRLSPEFQSVKGCGATYPNPEQSEYIHSFTETPEAFDLVPAESGAVQAGNGQQ
ncbi:poly [ADP-ribose] polymerase 1-like [Paramacrobiotus metropolitanus]|uniref:poly [ADP-ribose] polymerase 1-like n=1 Tax=Paramacrobiotus metropolitanus TaxID=2943436 RepID=UPI0024461E68|nr:poly [ADP-ribose] polymerase 1-like [Paramacrobiotus metropolitanus]